MFFDIVRKLPEGAQVVLESSGDRAALAIRAGRSRFTLQTLPESDFPDLAPGEMTHKFTLKAADLKRLIDKTQFAISTEETRYYLNGIYLHAAGTAKAQTLRAVATDGHRLAQMELDLPKGAAGMPGIIVPRKTVGEVQRLLEDNDAEVPIELSPGKIRFTVGEVVLTSKLIDGTFPDYGRVIPVEQRQGTDRRQEGIRGRGRPRLDRVERARPRRQAVDHRRQAVCCRSPTRIPAAPTRNSKSNTKPIRSISASTRAICSTSPPRSRARPRCSSSPIPGSPTLIQDKESKGALYVLMPMRV